MQKQQEIAKRRQEVLNTYEDIVNDVDTLLGKSTESSALLAEGDFESKRRDFIRFLQRVEEKCSTQVFMVGDAHLEEEFLNFVHHHRPRLRCQGRRREGRVAEVSDDR